MKMIRGWILGAALASLAVLPVQEAGAWMHRGFGGFSAGRVGDGWAHAGPDGVSAGRVGDGWGHRGYYGDAAHTDFVGVHNTYVVGGYHPGCYNCGAAAAAVGGLAVGAMAGAAIADASQPTTTVVVNQGSAVPMWTQVSSLPGGCEKMKVNSTLYYQCGSTWYKPGFGDSGVYYQAVPVP
jgi:hypothetical protein